MSIILGSDYEKKMSVVSLLKQYAETRDVRSFAQAIHHLLSKMPQRNLIREIRYVHVRASQLTLFPQSPTKIDFKGGVL
jgi:hypothetical protein